MVDHFGTYNPWDMSPETRIEMNAAIACGGFVYRTGVLNIATGQTTGDGLCIVSISASVIVDDVARMAVEGHAA